MTTEQFAVAAIARTYGEGHAYILALVRRLTRAQLTWRPNPQAQCIAFHLWHLARWADHLQAAIPGMTRELARQLAPGAQIWDTEGLAARWGFDRTDLGYAETGMGMHDAMAVGLIFPDPEVLLDYTSRAFAAAERAVSRVDAQQFGTPEEPQAMTEGVFEAGGTVGDAILSHLTHDSGHLGMIQCLFGLQAGTATATR